MLRYLLPTVILLTPTVQVAGPIADSLAAAPLAKTAIPLPPGELPAAGLAAGKPWAELALATGSTYNIELLRAPKIFQAAASAIDTWGSNASTSGAQSSGSGSDPYYDQAQRDWQRAQQEEERRRREENWQRHNCDSNWTDWECRGVEHN